MYRFSVLIAACCTCFLFQQGESLDTPTAPSTQESQESSPKAASSTAEEQRNRDAIVADIMNIKGQLGGGVAEVIGDISFDVLGKDGEKRREFVRKAARKLEEAAAILEEVNQYNQADKIRQDAADLWKSARQ